MLSSWSASGDPNFAGDVGVLSLLVGQFRHTPFAFAFALIVTDMLVFRLKSARTNGGRDL
jgi:hypothetical protein